MSDSGSFGVFALPNAEIGGGNPKTEVDDQGRAVRRRRHHVKSRAGCVACKQRRTKCDEVRPACSRCSSRNIECRFEVAPDKQHLSSQHRQVVIRKGAAKVGTTSDPESDSIKRNPGLGQIDMTAMRLVYHFDHFTSATLLFGTGIWRDQILPLALQHEQLMSAILMISATHLHQVQPAVALYARAAAHYLDHTLSGFRSSLEAPFEKQDADATVACAFLLLHYTWATPFYSLLDDTYPDPASDKLIPFAAGLKSVIVRAKEDGGSSLVIFEAVLQRQSIRRFTDWVSTVKCSYDFQERFLGRSHYAPVSDEMECWEACGMIHAADRLVPIFQTIDAVSRGEDVSEVMECIQTYSFMWPAKANKEFEVEVGENKVESLVVMLAFYASMIWLFSDDVWWVERRPRVMFETILGYLDKEARSTWKQCARRISDYFGFKLDDTTKRIVRRPGGTVAVTTVQ
ncbi:hypothetical protein GGR54DRAFT_590162 [Hypoxylon sp. NC1633]|nr:hypothetical protein GGR54DRAFT_590162 [Hypoxylon sp. NC1633]